MKVLIDSNVFIFGLMAPEQCNSKIILSLAEARQFNIVVSELAYQEVIQVAARKVSLKAKYSAAEFVRQVSRIVPIANIEKELAEYRGKIADKDLENLATAKHEQVDFIISFDRHYEKFTEYKTPKKFLQMLKIKHFATEY